MDSDRIAQLEAEMKAQIVEQCAQLVETWMLPETNDRVSEIIFARRERQNEVVRDIANAIRALSDEDVAHQARDGKGQGDQSGAGGSGPEDRGVDQKYLR